MKRNILIASYILCGFAATFGAACAVPIYVNGDAGVGGNSSVGGSQTSSSDHDAGNDAVSDGAVFDGSCSGCQLIGTTQYCLSKSMSHPVEWDCCPSANNDSGLGSDPPPTMISGGTCANYMNPLTDAGLIQICCDIIGG